jgi:hypothetical protein
VLHALRLGVGKALVGGHRGSVAMSDRSIYRLSWCASSDPADRPRCVDRLVACPSAAGPSLM